MGGLSVILVRYEFVLCSVEMLRVEADEIFSRWSEKVWKSFVMRWGMGILDGQGSCHCRRGYVGLLWLMSKDLESKGVSLNPR